MESKKISSSIHSIWPVYVVILEVRYKLENVLMIGVWFGKEKPSSDLFLEHFSKDFHQLELQGVDEHDGWLWGQALLLENSLEIWYQAFVTFLQNV